MSAELQSQAAAARLQSSGANQATVSSRGATLASQLAATAPGANHLGQVSSKRSCGQTSLGVRQAPEEQAAPAADEEAPEGRHTQRAASSASGEAQQRAGGAQSLQLAAASDESASDQAKPHHVGPVMGIFFKVWSLVKVTKVRHQQKMRRQNSDDASQFQYISGDHLAGAGQQAIRRATSEHCSVDSRNFRRAGSQPAAGQPCRMAAKTSSELALEPTQGQGTGFNFDGAQTKTRREPYEPLSAVRRHVSAYSLRRSTADVPLPTGSDQAVRQQQQQAAPVSAVNSSWTSRIKRSATTVNQGDLTSYVSRHRSRNERPRQVAARQQAEAQNNSSSSSNNNNNNNCEQLLQAAHYAQLGHSSSRPLDAPDSAINFLWSQNHNQGREQQRRDSRAGAARNLSENEDDEEDSNELYSTPRDSIQSVPNGTLMQQPVIIGSNERPQHGPAQSAAVHQAYPIVKSFSTSNFSQLVKQSTSMQAAANISSHNHNNSRFSPITESQDSSRPGEGRGEISMNDLQRQDSTQSTCSRGEFASGGQNNKRLNGSRFFISSSSSEDSNSPNQQQQQGKRQVINNNSNDQNNIKKNNEQRQQAAQKHLQQQASFTSQLEQRQAQISLQQGVHYHEPLIRRPETLLLEPTTGYMMPVSILTPTPSGAIVMPNGSLATTCSGASMSPLDGPLGLSSFGGFKIPRPTWNHQIQGLPGPHYLTSMHGYRKSPSLFEIQAHNNGPPSGARVTSRLGAKYPFAHLQSLSKPSLPPQLAPSGESQAHNDDEDSPPLVNGPRSVSNSISLQDCKLASHLGGQKRPSQMESEGGWQLPTISGANNHPPAQGNGGIEVNSEYKLAQMLLESGSNPRARDSAGNTVLMQAVISENLATIKCLIERGLHLNDTNSAGLTALDLVCSRGATQTRLEIFKFLIDNGADVDRARESDGTRLLDRLIGHHPTNGDKLPFIDYLLKVGAKLGSSTWLAAQGKEEVQLRLLRKLCQDGYFLYKKSSIEAAVYRFEYALKRIAELEQQLVHYHRKSGTFFLRPDQSTHQAVRQVKYQTYLGLSRCERKRKFYKRALEFAHLAILVDSISYEGYYSKAHILKDLGEVDDSLMAIDQTSRLVDKSIESLEAELKELQQQEEALMFDGGCFNLKDVAKRSAWLKTARMELNGNLDYMQDAKRYISKLKGEILDDKLRHSSSSASQSQFSTNPIAI